MTKRTYVGLARIVPFGSKAEGGCTWTVRKYDLNGKPLPATYTAHGYWRKSEAIAAARKNGYKVLTGKVFINSDLSISL